MKEFDAMKNITDKFLAKADLFVLKQKIQQVCDYFDYHNKNLTKTQEQKIYELKQLLNKGE